MHLYQVDAERIINLDLVADVAWENTGSMGEGQPERRYLVVSLAAPAAGSGRVLRFHGEPAHKLWEALKITAEKGWAF